jgi:hypothetical protein
MKGLNPMLAFLLGAAVVGLGVLGYILYERQNRVLKIAGIFGQDQQGQGRRYRGRQEPLSLVAAGPSLPHPRRL